MYKKIFFACLLTLACCFAKAQEIPPKSTTLVTDYTNTLALQDKQALENKLVAFNDSTSTQIAVVLIKSVGQYDIAQYAVALGRNWGVGQQGKNNGIVLLAALDDHKVTIQTGYGAEAAVPDAVTSQIIEQDIKPNFRKNNYYAGLDTATTSLMRYMKGQYQADAKPVDNNTVANNNNNGSGGGNIGIIIFIVVVVLILVLRNIGGGGGHIIGRRGGASPFWWFMGGSMLGGGFGGGSGSSGGGGFGGGSSGGGFGGFGGGSFGGGGSSGSW